MLKVDQYPYIRTAHPVYGKKIKQIARETGHSKNTITGPIRVFIVQIIIVSITPLKFSFTSI